MRSTRRHQNSRHRERRATAEVRGDERAIEQEPRDDEEHRDADVEPREVAARTAPRRSRPTSTRRGTRRSRVAAIARSPSKHGNRVPRAASAAQLDARSPRDAGVARGDRATRSSGRSSRNQLADAVTSVHANAVGEHGREAGLEQRRGPASSNALSDPGLMPQVDAVRDEPEVDDRLPTQEAAHEPAILRAEHRGQQQEEGGRAVEELPRERLPAVDPLEPDAAGAAASTR